MKLSLAHAPYIANKIGIDLANAPFVEVKRGIEPVIEKMNALAKQYYEQSRPVYCAIRGFVDEVVSFADIRRYMVAFTGAAYQNPPSFCPHHHLITPRIIKG
jgi:glutaconyl-CoA decarboxylase